MLKRERVLQDVIDQSIRNITANGSVHRRNSKGISLWFDIQDIAANMGVELVGDERQLVLDSVNRAFLDGMDNGYGCEVEIL